MISLAPGQAIFSPSPSAPHQKLSQRKCEAHVAGFAISAERDIFCEVCQHYIFTFCVLVNSRAVQINLCRGSSSLDLRLRIGGNCLFGQASRRGISCRLQEVLYCSVSSAIESGLSLFRIRPFGPNKKYKIVLIRLETDETRISPAHQNRPTHSAQYCSAPHYMISDSKHYLECRIFSSDYYKNLAAQVMSNSQQ